MMWDEETTFSYDNADYASVAEEARHFAEGLRADGASKVKVVEERTIISEGTTDAYQDGGTFIIRWNW